MQAMNFHFLQIPSCDLTGYVPPTVHTGAQPGGGTVALHPQGHRQQAVRKHRRDVVDTCNAGKRRGQARQDEQLSNI